MDFTNINDVAKFLNGVNKAVYGVAPFSKKIAVKHLSSDFTDELIINADCWCDIGSHKVPEWHMQNVQGDVSVCADCYDHFN